MIWGCTGLIINVPKANVDVETDVEAYLGLDPHYSTKNYEKLIVGPKISWYGSDENPLNISTLRSKFPLF